MRCIVRPRSARPGTACRLAISASRSEFRDVVGEAGVAPRLDVGRLGARRQRDHRQRCPGTAGAHRAGEVEPVHVRHLDVRHDRVEHRAGLAQAQRLGRARRRGDAIAGGAQDRRHQLAEEVAVLHHQHAARLFAGPPTARRRGTSPATPASASSRCRSRRWRGRRSPPCRAVPAAHRTARSSAGPRPRRRSRRPSGPCVRSPSLNTSTDWRGLSVSRWSDSATSGISLPRYCVTGAPQEISILSRGMSSSRATSPSGTASF